ncbi:MAG TPA: ribonuclease P protein component [Bacteroidia bacterium]
MLSHTFHKSERLTGKKEFEDLFENGKSFSVPPLRFIWLKSEHDPAHAVRIGISVPKKLFSKSVERNKLKRRIREAYRRNKHEFYEFLKKKNLTVDMIVIYTAKAESSYSEIEQKMIVSLQKLIALIK